MAPHALLHELGVPFDLVHVDVASGAHRAPGYTALNPNQRVPTLVHGDHVLYESAAILLYLCESHPESGLMPLPGNARRSSSTCVWWARVCASPASRRTLARRDEASV